MKKIFLIIFIFVLCLSFVPQVRAFSLSLLQPFGGKTGGYDEACTCSGGMLLKYTSLKKQQKYFVYQYGVTQPHSNYNEYTQGYWTVLNEFPIGICLVYEGEECESSNNTPNGTLYHEGTGGLPATSI